MFLQEANWPRRARARAANHFYHEPHLLLHQTHFHIIVGLENYFSAAAGKLRNLLSVYI